METRSGVEQEPDHECYITDDIDDDTVEDNNTSTSEDELDKLD